MFSICVKRGECACIFASMKKKSASRRGESWNIDHRLEKMKNEMLQYRRVILWSPFTFCDWKKGFFPPLCWDLFQITLVKLTGVSYWSVEFVKAIPIAVLLHNNNTIFSVVKLTAINNLKQSLLKKIDDLSIPEVNQRLRKLFQVLISDLNIMLHITIED